MALPLLRANSGKSSLSHSPAHDLESIVYVLGYTVLRRIVSTAGCPDTLEQAFKNCFGEPTVEGIMEKRTDRQPLTWHYDFDGGEPREIHIEQHMFDVMCDLFDELEKQVAAYKQQMADMYKTIPGLAPANPAPTPANTAST